MFYSDTNMEKISVRKMRPIRWKKRGNLSIPKDPGYITRRKFGINSMKKLLSGAINVIRNPSSLYKTVGKSFRSAFKSMDSYISKNATSSITPFSLFSYMDYKYGPEWVEYDILSYSSDSNISDKTDMLLGLRSILTSDVFFTSPWAFEKVAIALSGNEVIGDVPQTLDPVTMAYAMLVADVLRRDAPMSPDVESFIIAHLLDNGFSTMLYPFDIEGDHVPEEVMRITKEVKKHIESDGADDCDEIISVQVERYGDLLDNLLIELEPDIAEEEVSVH